MDEKAIIEGIMRVEMSNDHTNWKPIPKPPIGVKNWKRPVGFWGFLTRFRNWVVC